jgi:hypothetical protein
MPWEQTLIEQWEAMSERERDAWIADAIVYVSLTTHYNEDGTYGYLPRYTTDISAAMEAEEKIMQINARIYGQNLLKVCGIEYIDNITIAEIAHIPADRRCLAMYLTLMQQKEREEGQ